MAGRRRCEGVLVELRKTPKQLGGLIDAAGLSQREVAAFVGVTPAVICRLRKGTRKGMRPENAEKLARLLRVPMNELFYVRSVNAVPHNAGPGRAA